MKPTISIALGGGFHYDAQPEKTPHWLQQEPEGDLFCSISGENGIKMVFPPHTVADLYVCVSPVSCCCVKAGGGAIKLMT